MFLNVYDEKVKMHGENNGPKQMKEFFNAVTKYFENGGQGARIVAKKLNWNFKFKVNKKSKARSLWVFVHLGEVRSGRF